VRLEHETGRSAFPPPAVGVKAATVPLWAPTMVTAVLPVLSLRSWRRGRLRKRRLRDGCCVACGYDLRAAAGRCPECGTAPALVPAGKV
jgi:hypothetical protein